MTVNSDVPQVPRTERPRLPSRKGQSPLGRLAVAGYTVCGLVAAATPLLLWMAWSTTVFYLVILGGFLACCGIVLLSKFLPEYREEEERQRREH